MHSSQKGDIALYVALIMIVVMTSAAVVFTSLLSKQIPAARSVVTTERSFYAANSGLEEALFALARNNQNTTKDAPLTGSLEYTEGNAEYSAYATLSASGTTCASSEAKIGDLIRRVVMGGEGCE